MKRFLYISFFSILTILSYNVFGNDRTEKTTSTNLKVYDGIVAIVNGDIITAEDLENRLHLALFSIGGNADNEQKHKIKKEVLKEMIQEKLKKQCTKKFSPKNGWISDKDVKDALADIAKRNHLSTSDFLKLLKSKNIKRSDLEEQIFVNLSWIEYIRARYGKSVNVSEFELSRTVSEIKEKLTQESFYVCRMFFPITHASQENSTFTHVSNLNNMLLRGADFASIARQFSKSADANNGGEMGWIFQGQLSDVEFAALKTMEIGSHKIVKTNQGYVILFLRDKKEAGFRSYTHIKFAQVAVSFGQEKPSEESFKQLMSYLSEMKKTSKNCHEFMQKAKESGFIGVSDVTSGIIENMHPKFRAMLAKVPAGSTSDPIVTDSGVAMFCILDKKVHTIKEPTREEIKMQKTNERLSLLASREMQELTRKSYIKVDEKYGAAADFAQ